MVKEGADVELSIENIRPITNHRARARAFRAAVDCNTMALPPLPRGSQRGVEDVSQLPGLCESKPLTLGDVRDLLGHATVSLDRRDPDGEVPVQEALEAASNRCDPRLEAALTVRQLLD